MSDSGQSHLLKASPEPKDLFLCHTGSDKPWVESLAEKIESVLFQGRFLKVVFDKWDFAHSKNIDLRLPPPFNVFRVEATLRIFSSCQFRPEIPPPTPALA